MQPREKPTLMPLPDLGFEGLEGLPPAERQAKNYKFRFSPRLQQTGNRLDVRADREAMNPMASRQSPKDGCMSVGVRGDRVSHRGELANDSSIYFSQ